MTLLQAHPGESDAEVRAAADAILQSLDPSRPNWWHPFEIRGTYRCRGLIYREFYCVAGSVCLWLEKLARVHGERKILLVARDDPSLEHVETSH